MTASRVANYSMTLAAVTTATACGSTPGRPDHEIRESATVAVDSAEQPLAMIGALY
jgi:hypothetical protein